MGDYCWVCRRQRANERFSGKGHRDHVCKECMKLSLAERKQLEEVDEVVGFLSQSNISAKNIARLQILAESSDQEVASFARAVTEVARVKPHKRRRLKVLAQEHKELMLRLEQLGLWEIMQPY